MQPSLIVGAVLVAVTALVDALSVRVRVPPSIMLVVVGAVVSLVPAIPTVSIDPQIVLLLFLPPLIYASGVGMSWRGFRFNLRPILLLAIGCVLFTATAVAGAVHWLLAIPWSIAFLLGAVVSPPDPVAPMAIASRLTLPKRLLTVLEGEGVVNDATALILVGIATAAVTLGRFSLVDAGIDFVAIVVGELVWGIAIGWAMLRLRGVLRNPQAEILLALLTPYLAFWIPHMLGGSGVLAALVAGLHVSWNGRRAIAPPTRLQGYFVWGLVVHALEGLIFLLMGLQARAVTVGLDGGGWKRLVVAGVAVSVVVVVIRFVWVFSASYIPRWLFPSIRRADPYPAWQSVFLIGFTGIRGVVSLVAALSIPTMIGSNPFPERGLILFTAFCVIIVTLIGQGLVLPLLLPRLGLVAAGEAEATEAKDREVRARVEGVTAVLSELDAIAREGAPKEAVAILRHRHEARRSGYAGTADAAIVVSPVAQGADIQSRLIVAERRAIDRLYLDGGITDDARRRIERELDLEDAVNAHALESATGDRLADPETTGSEE